MWRAARSRPALLFGVGAGPRARVMKMAVRELVVGLVRPTRGADQVEPERDVVARRESREHLGREVMGAARTPVYAMPRLADLLRGGSPWRELFAQGHRSGVGHLEGVRCLHPKYNSKALAPY